MPREILSGAEQEPTQTQPSPLAWLRPQVVGPQLRLPSWIVTLDPVRVVE